MLFSDATKFSTKTGTTGRTGETMGKCRKTADVVKSETYRMKEKRKAKRKVVRLRWFRAVLVDWMPPPLLVFFFLVSPFQWR